MLRANIATQIYPKTWAKLLGRIRVFPISTYESGNIPSHNCNVINKFRSCSNGMSVGNVKEAVSQFDACKSFCATRLDYNNVLPLPPVDIALQIGNISDFY